ncbi:response regulator transcription factor [Spirillospora sp. NPDC047279]|uniref:response regulator transcription factor n=1 Tax=Spirillospora sp. NPDC047279 TaxID=3155478 RepID=UPI0033EB7903
MNASDTGAPQPIRVFLTDDHEVVRRGVAALLSAEDDIEIVGEAGTVAQALARIPAARPHVAVLDVRLPDGDGISISREIRSRMPEVARLREHRERVDPLAALSDQERQILDLIGEGLTYRQIGDRMFLAEKTVKNYVSQIFTKLGLSRRTQAATLVTRLKAEESEHR